MKNRIIIDLKVFNLILKELRGVKREIRALKTNTIATAKASQKRDIPDKIYSADVMRRLKITPATLIKYEKMGLLKFHKEGRNKVYAESEVMAFKKAKGRRKRLGKTFFKK